MARVVRVSHARQRYVMVPVLGEDGQPERVPVLHSKGPKKGEQVVTKKGPKFMTRTVRDLSQPLEMPKCDNPDCKHEDKHIQVSAPYKSLTIKTSAYGSKTMVRHDDCRNWYEWEYRSNLSSQVARIVHDLETALADAESTDDAESAFAAAAEEAEGIAEEKKTAADSVRDGFGHDTSASEELDEIAEALEEWARELNDVQIPEVPTCETCDGEGKVECDTCGGAGELEVEAGEGLTTCEDCSGEGKVDCDNECVEGEDLNAWRDELEGVDMPEASI